MENQCLKIDELHFTIVAIVVTTYFRDYYGMVFYSSDLWYGYPAGYKCIVRIESLIALQLFVSIVRFSNNEEVV